MYIENITVCDCLKKCIFTCFQKKKKKKIASETFFKKKNFKSKATDAEKE